MKANVWTRRGIMVIMTLLMSINFLCGLVKYGGNSLYADSSEETLIFIIEPQKTREIENC